jgi:ABC-type sugar transport system permease subunit
MNITHFEEEFASFRKALRKLGRGMVPYLFLLPSLVFLVVFTHYPIAKSLWSSLFKWNLANPEAIWTGLNNYRRLLEDDLFWLVLRNTAFYAIGTVIPSVSLALFLAVFANEKIRGLSIFRSAIFYPTIIPMAAAAMVWVWIYADGYGLINYYIRQLGMQSVPWINSLEWALPALMVVGIWKYVGYYMIIFLAGLQLIAFELYEAATIEGANPWTKFWRITFPLISPTTFFVVIIAIINSFQSIDQVYIMTQGGPANATNVIVYYIYENAFLYADFGYGFTLSSVLFVILLLFTIIYFLALSRRVHYA